MMLALAIHLLLSVAQDPVSDQELERLVEDLGARDKASRESAVAALQKIGEPAFPRLRKAATDLDAERALLARQILLSFRKPGPEGWNKDPLPVTSVVYQDWVRGVSFKMAPDGTVELTVPEEEGPGAKRAFKTYRADSLAAFKLKYPDLTRAYPIESMAAPAAITKEILEWWRSTWEWLGILESEKQSGSKNGMEIARLGLTVSPTTPALRAQLDLNPGEGVLVETVREGSIAHQAGIRPYDVIVKLDGKEVREPTGSFTDLAEQALHKENFAIEVIRNAKSCTLTVKTLDVKVK